MINDRRSCILRVGAALIAAGGLTTTALYWRATKRNAQWGQSKSSAEIQRIEAARRQGAAGALEEIGGEARARYGRMQTAIAAAQEAGAERLDNKTHDLVADAERYAAFDLLSAARADLNQNAVSANSERRIGGQTPGVWKENLDAEDSRAVSSSREGRLALALQDLQKEVAQEDSHARQVEGTIERFAQHAPVLFGGALRQQVASAQADLQEFKAAELEAERGLLTTKTAAMRGRVDRRLYAEDAAHREHRDRRDRLAALHDSKTGPAVGTAREADAALRAVIQHRGNEAMHLAQAAANTHVHVIKTRTKANGETETYTDYEDHSFMYRAMASSDDSAAEASARQAQDRLERLRAAMGGLYVDPVLAAEGLTPLLPVRPTTNAEPGHGPLTAFLPAIWGMFASMSSSAAAERARAEFAPTLAGIERVAGEVVARRDAERRWVEDRISADVRRQMDEEIQEATKFLCKECMPS